MLSLTDLGSRFGKYHILYMKIREFLAMTFWTVKTFIELKQDTVYEGINTISIFEVNKKKKTARIPDFCLLKTESMSDFAAKPHTGSNNLNVNVRNCDIFEDALRQLSHKWFLILYIISKYLVILSLW